MLTLFFVIACSRVAPQAPAWAPPSPLPAQPSALALGISSESFGVQTVWIALSGDTVERTEIYDGLRLHTAMGPQHLQEIAARAEKDCETATCSLTLSRVVDGKRAADLRAALDAEAAGGVGCLNEHTLQRIQSATPERLVLADASGGAGCTTNDPGFEEITYRTQVWGGRGITPVPADAQQRLDQALRDGHPQQYDPALAGRAHVLRERAAGVSRDRAVVVTEDGHEVSAVFGEQTDATDFAMVLRRWPDATDVLTAPDRRAAVLRRGSSALAVVRLSDGAVLWSSDALPGRIAMAEWVTGPDRAMWAGALQR